MKLLEFMNLSGADRSDSSQGSFAFLIEKWHHFDVGKALSWWWCCMPYHLDYVCYDESKFNQCWLHRLSLF